MSQSLVSRITFLDQTNDPLTTSQLHALGQLLTSSTAQAYADTCLIQSRSKCLNVGHQPTHSNGYMNLSNTYN